MSIEDLVGVTYGPYSVRVTAERMAAYVAATGDDRDRWLKHAPPSLAGALLFAAAPDFLRDPLVVPYTRRLVHADQSFTWHRAIEAEEEVTVDGVFSRARRRAGVIFATFDAVVSSQAESVISSTSTFLMGANGSAEDPDEEPEPPVMARGTYDPLPEPSTAGSRVPEMARSASRLDLVRYASASGDFNPVHFDHDTAVAAGFAGVPVHGLLMGAWILQVAGSFSSAPDGLASAKLRFRKPLRPGETAVVSGTAGRDSEGKTSLRLALRAGDTDIVKARVQLRVG